MVRLLGIDLGTTGLKALLINERGEIIWRFFRDYPLGTPQPGWTEQDPQDWAKALHQCLESLEFSPDAIGLSGQMHGSVFLDLRGAPVHPIILWNDQRTQAESEEMVSCVGLDRIMEITCNPPLTGFQAPKILWLRKHQEDLFKQTSSVLLPKDYLRFLLSGEKATEVSDASGTSLFHVPERRWAYELMEALGLSPSLFPLCTESFIVSTRGKKGKVAGVPIVGGGGDQAAGALGAGAVVEGVISISLGTSGVVFTSQEEPIYDPKGRVHTFCHCNGKWHSMGVILNCGGALRWARDALGFSGFEEMADKARKAEATTVVFKPYLAGERTPYNNPELRGSFRGLSLADGREEMARAIFEGVTFALLDGYESLHSLRASSPKPEVIRVTGGGARSDYWMQLLGDTFGVPTVRLRVDEGPAFGAAILAGVGIGVWEDVITACRSVVQEAEVFHPDMEKHEHLSLRRQRWQEWGA
ncbi:MAG: xylulokinase [Candidatus Caldarchaeum sp.]